MTVSRRPPPATFEELRASLEGWVHFGSDDPPYDFVGMTALLEACLKNLGRGASRDELHELPEMLDEDARSTLRAITKHLDQPR